MAATPGYVNSAVITWAASTTATVSSQSIGTASWDRVVVVAVSIEADFDISSCTIGGTAATAGPVLKNTGGTPDISTAFFYLPVPTGTTANIAVTLSGSSSSIGRISTWAMTGGYPVHVDSGSGSGSGASITLATVTVPTNGCGMWAWANATNTAVAWTPSNNPSERDDAGAGTSGTAYRHSVADTVTAGTASVVADGATAQQVIVGMSFAENPPAMGWDRTAPTNSMAIQTAAKVGFVASVASGLVLAPYPYVQEAIPDFAHASTTSGYAFAKNLFYQARIAPPPTEPPFVAPTTMDWVQPLGRAAPPTKLRLSGTTHTLQPISQPTSLFDVRTTYLAVKVLHYQDKFEPVAIVAEDNTVTPDKWLPSWRGPPRNLLELPGGQPFIPAEATRENTVTPDKWLTPFLAAVPHTWPAKPAVQPFVPFQAPAVTPDEWMRPFTPAVPSPHLNVSQITYAAPPVAEDNTVTIDKWRLDWNLAAKAPKPIHTQPVFGYPYEGIDNTRREWDWSIQWRGPPKYQPPRIAAQPFIPKEAVLENTVTPDAWLFRWAKAVPVPKPVPTQPVLGYPYTSQAIVVPYEQWWHQPLSRAVARPQVHNKPYQPFVPRAAVLENTQTPDKWLKPLGVAAKRPPVRPTQPFYGYPYQAQVSLTTTLEWLQAWQGPPRYQPVKTWLQPWAPRPPVVVPDTFAVFSVETAQVSTRALFYESWSTAVPYPYEGVVSDQGPADEHERVACVPLASRVAIVPELSRVVEVPVNDREQASNEYRDRTCGTPETPAAVEPEVPTGEDAPFQDDPFDDDAFQV